MTTTTMRTRKTCPRSDRKPEIARHPVVVFSAAFGGGGPIFEASQVGQFTSSGMPINVKIPA